jgi:predicted permease
VLLIACANVANLLLARASAREKELGIRAALGAGRSRLVRQLLTESLILALAGGMLGVLLANLGVSALRALVPANTPRVDEVHLDSGVLAFTFGISLITGLLFGLAPAWHIARTDLRERLNEAARGSSAGGSRVLRAGLVVSELAVAAVLLVGASLMIRSFERLLEASPGFQTQHLLTMGLSLPEKAYKDGVPVQNFFTQLLAKVRTVPGVESAGAVSEMPLTDSYNSGSVFFADSSVPGLLRLPEVGNFPYTEIDQHAATPGYFEAMQIPLVRGRLLNYGDDAAAPLVVVVDTDFAKRFWPNGDALGQKVAVDTVPNLKPAMPRWRTIVGVVGHVKHYGLAEEGREQIYVSHEQPDYGSYAPRDMTLAVRASQAPASITSAIREQVFAMDKNIPLYNVATMDQLISTSVAQPRLNLSLLVTFAALALLLAAVGVYGVMAYTVTQRTQEFGIRVALGAAPADILRQVILEGGRLAAMGLGIGIVAALIFSRVMGSLLYGVKPSDPMALGVAAGVLIVVALAACYIPARRATRVDPLVALRYE